MFNVEKEYEPGGDGYCILNHSPGTDWHHGPDFTEVELCRFFKSIFLKVTSMSCVYYKENERHKFREAGSDRCSSYSEGRETQFAEYKNVVKYYIGQNHYHRVQCEGLGLGGSHIESPEYGRHEGEDHTRKSPSDITQCRPVDGIG